MERNETQGANQKANNEGDLLPHEGFLTIFYTKKKKKERKKEKEKEKEGTCLLYTSDAADD